MVILSAFITGQEAFAFKTPADDEPTRDTDLDGPHSTPSGSQVLATTPGRRSGRALSTQFTDRVPAKYHSAASDSLLRLYRYGLVEERSAHTHALRVLYSLRRGELHHQFIERVLAPLVVFLGTGRAAFDLDPTPHRRLHTLVGTEQIDDFSCTGKNSVLITDRYII